MLIPEPVRKECLDEAMDYLLIRSAARAKAIGEVFTPTELVLELLEQLPDSAWEEGKTYLDPSAGNGQFLAAVLIIKQSLGHRDPLDSVYGIELMQDNVDECRQRLILIAGDTQQNREAVNWNIRCANFLTFDLEEFDRTIVPQQDRASKHVE